MFETETWSGRDEGMESKTRVWYGSCDAMIRRKQDLRATNTDIRSFDQDTRNDGESLSMSLRNL